jgi:hypothetical protein
MAMAERVYLEVWLGDILKYMEELVTATVEWILNLLPAYIRKKKEW